MMAEMFKENGYHTYGFNSNPYISHYYNFHRGFDLYQDNMPKATGKTVKKSSLFLFTHLKALLSEPYENAETINAQAIEQLRSIRTPYFMWIHYMDVHGPYIPKRGWRTLNRIKSAYLWRKSLQRPTQISGNQREWLIKSYKDEISYLDAHLAALLTHINQDDTIVIVTADHGDLFGEHNLYGHTLKLYNQLLHIPLVIKHPQMRPGRTIQSPVRSLDLLPTLTDMLGLQGRAAFDGKSLLPLMNGHAGDTPGPILSEVSRKHLCVEQGHWKLIVNYKTDVKELYNLQEDPYERSNRRHELPHIAAELEEIIQKHLASHPPQEPTPRIEHDEAMRARLQALGYME
jgi:arylsulfatase